MNISRIKKRIELLEKGQKKDPLLFLCFSSDSLGSGEAETSMVLIKAFPGFNWQQRTSLHRRPGEAETEWQERKKAFKARLLE